MRGLTGRSAGWSTGPGCRGWHAPTPRAREFVAPTRRWSAKLCLIACGNRKAPSKTARAPLPGGRWQAGLVDPVSASGGTARLFIDGRFATAGGRARIAPPSAAGPARAMSPAFPLTLNSGRVRDHWHTITKTGLMAGLCRHIPEPSVDIHPCDAAAIGVSEGQLTCIQTEQGDALRFENSAAGVTREAWLEGGRLKRAPGASRPLAPLVCTCLGVRVDRIGEAILQGAATEDEISGATAAGSNCGSCRPEIRRLLAASARSEILHAA